MLNRTLLVIIPLVLVAPLVARAAAFDEYVYTLIIPLQESIPLLVGIAIVVFIWGVIRYLASGDDPTKKEGSKRILVIGVVGIFVLVSIWGIVAIILGIFFGGVPGDSPFYTEPPRPTTDPGNLIPEQQRRTLELCPPDCP